MDKWLAHDSSAAFIEFPISPHSFITGHFEAGFRQNGTNAHRINITADIFDKP